MKHPLIPAAPLIQSGPAPGHSELSSPLRVCVWNWHKATRPGWRKDFLHLCKQHDLFLAQEVRLSPSVLEALHQSGLAWHTAAGFLSPIKKFPTGVAAGCRTAVQDILCQSPVREPIVGLPKMTLRLVYPFAGTRLCVINTHAINFTRLKPFEKTLQLIAQLISGFDGPVLVAGDFNTWSPSRIRILQKAARQWGLSEVAFTPDTRTRYLSHPVDYLFVRGLTLQQAEVLPLHSSDHRPLSATLRLAAK